MRDLLLKILEDYNTEKMKPFKGNKFNVQLKARSKELFLDNLINKANYQANYKVNYSAGQGRWANVPWIGIFDEDITLTAKEGYYIVYLFSQDMTKVYLSLNQGWIYYKNTFGNNQGKKKIKMVSEMWQMKLKSDFGQFHLKEINLEGSDKEGLSHGYELGHICGKLYEINSIPNNTVLEDDLKNMIDLYEKLKKRMVKVEGKYSFVDTNYMFIEEKEILDFLSKQKYDKIKAIDDIVSYEGKNTTLNVNDNKPANSFSNISETTNKADKHAKHVDYVQKAKYQQRIGLAGEYMVLNYEKNKLKALKESNKLKSNKTVEHISMTKGDSVGFDIKSYEENDVEIHIEVKTTEGGIDCPFYMSSNEVNYSKEQPGCYRLYRIYNFNPQERTGDLYIIKGNVTQEVELIAKTYVSAGLKK